VRLFPSGRTDLHDASGAACGLECHVSLRPMQWPEAAKSCCWKTFVVVVVVSFCFSVIANTVELREAHKRTAVSFYVLVELSDNDHVNVISSTYRSISDLDWLKTGRQRNGGHAGNTFQT